MPGWLPTSASPRGRLVLRAVELFGARGFDGVGVGELAAAAETTTGPLYHHFGSKLGLYAVVRSDVEQRLVDRVAGALAGGGTVSAALVVGFDFAATSGFLRLLGDPPQPGADDPLVAMIHPALGEPLATMVAAAWRRALLAHADGSDAAATRTAIAALPDSG